jgi:hypothetical protein
MAPLPLFNLAQDHPPKTPLRRFLWACAVFLFCAGVLPFLILGGIQQWATLDLPSALFTTFLAAALLFGLGAAISAFVDLARSRRGAGYDTRPSPGRDTRSQR